MCVCVLNPNKLYYCTISENSSESNFGESEEEEEISDIFSQNSVNESD